MRGVFIVIAVLALGAGCGGGSGAARHPQHPARPDAWNECETYQDTICGSFAWNPGAQHFDARWENGAEGTVTVRITGDRIEMERVDTGGPYPGTRGSYRGARTANGFAGEVTWTVPNGNVIQGHWEASGDPPAPATTAAAAAPSATPAPSAEEQPRAPEAQAVPPTGVPAPAPAVTAAVAPESTPSPSCLLDALVSFAGRDRHFACGDLYTIEEVHRPSCSATATAYMGPAMSMRHLLQAGPSAPARQADDDAELHVISRQGSTFRIDGHDCRDLTEEQFESAIAESESVPTMVDEE